MCPGPPSPIICTKNVSQNGERRRGAMQTSQSSTPSLSILLTTAQPQAASTSSSPSPMATLPPASHLRHPLPSFSSPPTVPRRATIPPARASEPDSNETASDTTPPVAGSDFEDRLAEVRLRYRSGAGKKAEQRKTRKTGVGKKGTGSGGVFLPPVPLAEPVSGGLAVDVGFSPYTERLNGRIAMLGLAALLLVDLASGKSVINYHSPAIVFIQVYFVAAVGAVYVKYEKEKVSIWPEKK